MVQGGNHPQPAAADAPMDDQEFDAQPNLLHVSVYFAAAVKICNTLLALERNDFNGLGGKEYLMSLVTAAIFMQVYLVYMRMAFKFFAGRVYCRNSGALTGILENHLLVGDLNVGGWSAEEYARMSFPGQKEFEDRFRVRFSDLLEKAQEIMTILARINVPTQAGLAAPLSGPDPSIISGTEMQDGDDSEMQDGDESEDIDPPTITKSPNADTP